MGGKKKKGGKNVALKPEEETAPPEAAAPPPAAVAAAPTAAPPPLAVAAALPAPTAAPAAAAAIHSVMEEMPQKKDEDTEVAAAGKKKKKKKKKKKGQEPSESKQEEAVAKKLSDISISEKPTPPPGQLRPTSPPGQLMPTPPPGQLRPTPPPGQLRSPPSDEPEFEPPKLRTKRNFEVGKSGRPINLAVNYFELKIKNQKIYHYDVDINPDKPKWIFREVIEMVRKTCLLFKNYYPVFDGRKNLYTARELPQRTITAEVKVPKGERELTFNVTIKLVSSVDIDTALKYCDRENKVASSSNIPQTAVQALDLVLMNAPALRFTKVGRKFFTEPDRVLDIGRGNEVWFGHYQSIRLVGWKPMLNIDTANKAFYTADPVVDCICKILRKRCNDLHRGLNLYELQDFRKHIKGLKVEYKQGNGCKRSYRVNEVVKSAREQTFDLDGTPSTVEAYWKSCNVHLRFPNLPCLHVGPLDKTIYIPVERCTIENKQVNNRKLTDDQTANMIRYTATDAMTRRVKIMKAIANTSVGKDQFCKEFGISVSDEMIQVRGRVLDPPTLSYGRNEGQSVIPRDGVWQMRGKQFIAGQKMENWAILNLDKRMKDEDLMKFIRELQKTASQAGLIVCDPKNIQKIQQTDIAREMQRYSGMQLVMVVLPGREGNIYAEVKKVGDMDVKVTTQCLQSKNIWNPKPATLSNICLKLNSKLGGINNAIHRNVRPKVFDEPVLVMGADVTHPAPDQKKLKPSIAAIVGSTDPSVDPRKYVLEIRIQDAAQDVEMIVDLENVTISLMMKFYRGTNGKKPKKIIFFRDGVSEGQFHEVLKKEVSAIRRACRKMEADYQPGITFIVVQKRHHTRLFPTPEDAQGRGKNVPPGTIIDQGVNHPTEFDYFLCSHQGIQGTSRPCHYHLLWDDNNFSPEDLEKMSYYLCHTFVRCTRSVSYPAPAYYAHLAAYRGRMHHDSLILGNQRKDEHKIQEVSLPPMYFV